MGIIDRTVDHVREESARRQAIANANSPSGIYAGIMRDQWQDTVQRGMPLEDMANAAVLDPARRLTLREDALDLAQRSTDNAFDRVENQRETLYSRSNQMMSDRERKASERMDAVDRTRTTVAARNATNRYVTDRENAMLGIGGGS